MEATLKKETATGERLESIYNSLKVELPPDVLKKLIKGDFSVIDWHCVDGRPSIDGNFGVRRFGGSFGFLVNMTGALIECKPDFCLDDLDVLFTLVSKRFGDKLSYHTDESNPDSCRGCGYLKHALYESLEEYGLTKEAAQKLASFLPSTRKITLEGDHHNHKEVGIVELDTHEVLAKEGDQIFAWNSRHDNIVLFYLVGDLVATLDGLEPHILHDKATNRRNRNMATTIKKLDVEHLNIYKATE